jgi:FkbM family methyltransferase
VPRFQSIVQAGAKIVPRGWSIALKAATRLYPRLREYEIELRRGGKLFVDMRYKMCVPYILYGELPHERGVDRLIRYLVRPGDVCVDVGASIGYYTQLLSEIVGPKGLVIAYEPIPAALRILQRNVAANTNVRIIDAALSNRSGEADFFIASAEDMSSLAPTSGRASIRVRLETLDALLSQVPSVDFVKIDVEGFEYEVLQGGMEVLRQFRPSLTFELTKQFIDRFGHDMEDFCALLEPLGYTLYWLDNAREGPLLAGADRSNAALAVPAERMHAFVSG